MAHTTEIYEDNDCYDEELIGPATQIGPAEFAVAIRLYSAEYSHNHDASWFRRMLRLHNEQVLVACYGNLN
ncbi:hypothetical protein [Methanocella sp. MCL-LM]|uniref:hypothetical protein n=1 Tax=Methanocella sp. MCL-LM TaxID=3412035 RepID=UPI003C70F315